LFDARSIRAPLTASAAIRPERWASEEHGAAEDRGARSPGRGRDDFACTCVGACLVGATALLPWISAGTAGDPRGWTAVGVPVLGLAVIGLAVAIVVGGFADRSRAPNGPSAALAAAFVGAGACGVFILLVEMASSFLPHPLLPRAVQRLGLTVEPGPGPWLALTVLLALAVWLAVGRRRRVEVRGGLVLALVGRRFAVAGFVGLVGATAALAWLRYVPWTDASVAHRTVDVQGWATPWLGPASLFVVWLLVAALAAVALVDVTLGALIAGCAGWFATLNAALVIIAADAFGSVGLDRVLPTHAAGVDVELSAAASAWGVFVAGLVAAGASMLLIASQWQQTAVSR
jgi:hypothetical protein